MLQWDGKKRLLDLVEFDLERAIASFDKGQPVIRVWLDCIHQELQGKLRDFSRG
jgi:hypothetical protein